MARKNSVFFSHLIAAEANSNKAWVYNPRNETVVEGVCKAYQIFGEVNSFDPVNEQCDVTLPFMCMKSAKSVGKKLILLFAYSFTLSFRHLSGQFVGTDTRKVFSYELNIDMIRGICIHAYDLFSIRHLLSFA